MDNFKTKKIYDLFSSYIKITLLICTFILGISHSHADNARYESWTFYMDNDVLSHKFCQKAEWCAENDDRAYTGGFGLGFQIKNSYSGIWTELTRDAHLFLSHENKYPSQYVQNDMYGFTVFTPDELDDPDRTLDERPDPIFGDRPFASMWFYTSTISFKKKSDDGVPRGIRSQFTLSILGTDVGRNLQELIHCDLGGGACPVEGWQNNINDGEDLAFSMGKSYLYLVNKSKNNRHELIGELGYNLGLYTELNTGITYRFGTLVSPFYSLNADPFSNANKFLRSSERERYLWLSLKSHIILYNGLLQGWHLFSDSGPVEYDSNEIEPLLFSLSLGYVFPITKNSTLNIKVQGRTSELKGNISKDHAWGGIYWTKKLN